MKYWLAPAGLHVALAEPDDAAQLAKMHAESFFSGWPEDEIRNYIQQPKHHSVYVATNPKRQIAGFMVLRQVADECELLTIAVARRWRRKGVGDALMRAGFSDLMQSPAKTMFLEVEDGNRPAIALYQRHGFQPVSRREAYYDKGDGPRAAALVMRRDLS